MLTQALRYCDGKPVDVVAAHRCDTSSHRLPVLATVRMHWVDGPVEYCAPCAARMRAVAAVFGMHVHEEPIPPPPPVRVERGLALEGLDG